MLDKCNETERERQHLAAVRLWIWPMTSALATAVVLCLSPREISFIFYTAMTRKLSAEKKIEGFWGTLDGKQVSALHSSAYEYVGECGGGGERGRCYKHFERPAVPSRVSRRLSAVKFRVVAKNLAFAFASAPATGCFPRQRVKERYRRSFLPAAVRLYNQRCPQHKTQYIINYTLQSHYHNVQLLLSEWKYWKCSHQCAIAENISLGTVLCCLLCCCNIADFLTVGRDERLNLKASTWLEAIPQWLDFASLNDRIANISPCHVHPFVEPHRDDN